MKQEKNRLLITFGKIDLGTQHKEEEFAIDKFTEENGNTTGSVENQEFQVHYPSSTMGRDNFS